MEILKRTKIRVSDAEQGRALQRKLFAMGFTWQGGSREVREMYIPYLLVHDNGTFVGTGSEKHFGWHGYREVSAREILEEYVPKFGDIVRVDTDTNEFLRTYMICIMPDKAIPERRSVNGFYDIANIIMSGELSLKGAGYDENYIVSPASASEKQELFSKLEKAGKKWNAEKKCLEEIEQEPHNLNLVEILKDCPKGTKFYSTIFGDVEFVRIEPESEYPIEFITIGNGKYDCVTQKGFHRKEYDGECTLFPSKDQRDWSKWVCPKPALPIDTPVMVNDGLNSWVLRYYAQDKECWVNGYKSTDNQTCTQWRHIIPFDKFNPNDIEGSLKHDICAERK